MKGVKECFYAAMSQLSALYCSMCSCGVMISNGLLSLSIVKADKLRHFSRLFRIYADELLDGDNLSLFDDGLLRGFAELDDIDRRGILNLIEFKKMMKIRRINLF